MRYVYPAVPRPPYRWQLGLLWQGLARRLIRPALAPLLS